ncbi:hypothetical protein QM291_30305, partial [Pseudomonas aeruginosa]|nr:hypothetical protein [Pseudomonas aeruginosa]
RQNIDLAARRAWLDKVRAILAERLQDPPGLEELARRLNCSSRSQVDVLPPALFQHLPVGHRVGQRQRALQPFGGEADG